MTREARGARRGTKWRIVGWSFAALLLLLPLAAMQFTDEVAWSGGDFAFVAVLCGIVGGAFELTVRMSRDLAYRAGVAAALAAASFVVVATGAVGMIGDEGNLHNLFFLAVVALALAGAVMARFRAAGMALAMAVAGAAQIAVALAGLSIDPRGAVLSAFLAGPWLLSAALFRAAARSAEND